MKIITTYIYLILFVLSFLHSEIGLSSVEGCNNSEHDICQILEQSNIPTTNIQISVIQILAPFLLPNIAEFDYSVMNFFHRNDFIYNPLTQFFKAESIHFFKSLLI